TILILFPICCIVLFLAAAYLLPFDFHFTGKIVGHPEYCNYPITHERAVRLVYIPSSNPVGGHQIDPNNWKHEPLAFDFMAHMVVVIPYFEYEVTQDGGGTWMKFWHHDNLPNRFPDCDNFALLDTDNFWLWTYREMAVTHDGGRNWIVKEFMRENS